MIMITFILQMCGRSIAPLKMMHRIKHMAVDFEEPDRMQLFEFLDLVLWYIYKKSPPLIRPPLLSGQISDDQR
jgi:hypothetical protein